MSKQHRALSTNPLEEQDEIMEGFYRADAGKPASQQSGNTAEEQEVDAGIPIRRHDGNTAEQGEDRSSLVFQKVTVRLPKDLVKRIKITAVEQELTVQDLIEDAVLAYLE